LERHAVTETRDYAVGLLFGGTNFNSWLVVIIYHNEFRLVSWPYPLHRHLF